ncbi:phage tail protein [Brachyspira intermedia]|uniref:phage tail protein n=1 Tax=Brachyspira intermedia TaxID=84377 RepID=UPI0030072397
MSIIDLVGNKMNATEGLNVYTGASYRAAIAKTQTQNEEVNFSDNLNKQGKYIVYPTNVGVAPTVEQLTADYVGAPTTDTYPGAITYAGDFGIGGFPNSIAYYISMVWADVQTKNITSPIMVISGLNNFALKFTVEDTVDYKATRLEILTEKDTGDSYNSRFIDITDGMTNGQLIEAINNFDDFSARLQIGSLDSEADFSQFLKDNKLNDELVFAYKRIAFLESGLLTDEEKKQYPAFLSSIMPRQGEPQYFNALVSQIQSKMSTSQYVGCQFKSINFNFANKALTTISSSLWVTSEKTFNEAPKIEAERTENRDVVMAQTNKYPTKMFISGLEAMSVSDATIAFEWTKDDIYNISVIRYNTPNGKYTLTIGGNAMFNKQSEELFYNWLLNGQRLSMVLETNMKWKNKYYPLIFVCTDVNGQPSKPAIAATGNLQVALNGFQGLEQSEDFNSNYCFAFTDRESLF